MKDFLWLFKTILQFLSQSRAYYSYRVNLHYCGGSLISARVFVDNLLVHCRIYLQLLDEVHVEVEALEEPRKPKMNNLPSYRQVTPSAHFLSNLSSFECSLHPLLPLHSRVYAMHKIYSQSVRWLVVPKIASFCVMAFQLRRIFDRKKALRWHSILILPPLFRFFHLFVYFRVFPYRPPTRSR